ncbi:MAG: tetratricopeptide repeat protein [Ignavibacteria bacterium]|jgi:tetratricopeptide (TPR) repeat protein|nr:tetratricopeptide repeat protein [Ignavibacteria bacterium]
MKITKQIIIAVLVLVIASIIYAPAVYPQAIDQQFQLAQSYEQGGDYANALRLYLEIYASNKSEKYFEPIARIYKQQNRYEELKPIVEERMKSSVNASILILAGEVYWKLGQPNEANVCWDRCRKDFGKDPRVYIELATTLNVLRQFDKSANVLLEAKQKFNDHPNVVDALLRTYIYLGNYTDGFRELLYQYALTKNLQQAEGRLLGLMTSEDAVKYIDNAFAREITKNNDVQLLILYAWFLRSIKNYDKALDIYAQIDAANNAKGNEIYVFAEQSRLDGDYDIAMKAYRRVMDMGKSSPYANASVYNYTKTMEERFFNKSALSKEEANEIINSYKKIVSNFPKTDYSEQAKLRIAYIEDSIMQNKQNAMDMLNSVIATNFSPLYVIQAMNELTDIYIEKGQLNEANTNISSILQKYGNQQKANPQFQYELSKCKYDQAETQYYYGNTDSALALYYSLAETLEDDIANDALSRITFIEQNKDLVKPLNLFIKAEYLEKQGKYDEALSNYYDVVKFSTGEALGEKALVSAAVIEVSKKNYAKANKLLSDYITDNAYPLYGDNALYLLGDIAIVENKKDDAINYYADILVKYPRSILISDTRRKIREIRQE